jgi:trans-2,3-dihydro-3-hydroxyanthranilate isomerase
VPFLFIPLKNLKALQSIQFRREVWQRVLGGLEASGIFVFTQEVETSGSTVHSRMFGPAVGVLEDPATGSASGPLGCYLVRHGLVTPAGALEIVSEQGFEMGRPSFIRVRIEQEGGQIIGVYVGGTCYYMGQGFFRLAEDQGA